jgi:co-chaperonin GroES (HSP10)
MKEFGVKDVSYAPIYDEVLIWRLPPLGVSSSGLLFIPEDARSPHIKGLLMAMGPMAMDTLISNGVEVGHIVTWKRYAGDEFHDHTKTRRLMQEYIVVKARDVIGSDDLKRELDSGKAKYVRGADGRHSLQRQLSGGKVEKLRALAASTTSPAEAETATRIADRLERKGA